MGELEKILADEHLTVERLFYRLLLAETDGLRARVVERRYRQAFGEGGSHQA